MSLEITESTVKNILTRTSGYLSGVTSHSLQPYRGCSYGNSLCGVGCYVQHNRYVLQGRTWGSFLEVRTNAAESYRHHVSREQNWAERRGLPFSIFLSSSTDPFVPQERRYGVTRSVLEAMCDNPPDELILQTHSHLVQSATDILIDLKSKCCVRVHISIESDRDCLPGLPPPCSSVEQRLKACEATKAAGLFTVVTVSPILPMDCPDEFFKTVANVSDAVVLDHFIGGDGSNNGQRTLKTDLPAAMRAIDPESTDLDFRQRIIDIANRYLPGRVGVSCDGFAGKYLED
ncbi:MAG: hypothetical protein O2955_14245 [Planctomycetota bacterium]|nr:hypothetical protein [Planctomycetota bacterium]